MRQTSVFFQMARGRAMVRQRCMGKARAAKWHAEHAKHVEDREAFRRNVAQCVQRARQAHRDWRKYRAWHVEYIAL